MNEPETTHKLETDSTLVQEYKYGFVTDLATDELPKGLSEDVVRAISKKKNEPEWMTEWRLKAYRRWLKMTEPTWSRCDYPPIDYQNIRYYSAPKQAGEGGQAMDPELARTFEKLGVPLYERDRLAGVAVDAVFDSISVATTHREALAEKGIRELVLLQGDSLSN